MEMRGAGRGAGAVGLGRSANGMRTRGSCAEMQPEHIGVRLLRIPREGVERCKQPGH
jgi:hypothetical protein